MSEAQGAQAGPGSDAAAAVAAAVAVASGVAVDCRHTDAAEQREASKASESGSSTSTSSGTNSSTDFSELSGEPKSSSRSKDAAEVTPMYLELDLNDFALDPATYEEVESPMWLDPPHIGTPSLPGPLGIDSTDAERAEPTKKEGQPEEQPDDRQVPGTPRSPEDEAKDSEDTPASPPSSEEEAKESRTMGKLRHKRGQSDADETAAPSRSLFERMKARRNQRKNTRAAHEHSQSSDWSDQQEKPKQEEEFVKDRQKRHTTLLSGAPDSGCSIDEFDAWSRRSFSRRSKKVNVPHAQLAQLAHEDTGEPELGTSAPLPVSVPSVLAVPEHPLPQSVNDLGPEASRRMHARAMTVTGMRPARDNPLTQSCIVRPTTQKEPAEPQKQAAAEAPPALSKEPSTPSTTPATTPRATEQQAAEAAQQKTQQKEPETPATTTKTVQKKEPRRRRAVPTAASLVFEELLSRPCCKQLKAGMLNFFKEFEKATKGNVDDEAQAVHCLIGDVEKTMKGLEPWRDLPPNTFVVAKEEMEKFVFDKLYNTLFFKKKYQAEDSAIAAHNDRIRPLVTADFLELKEEVVNHEVIPLAIQELGKIDSYKTPFEKLACLCNAFRVMSFVLVTGGKEGSADDILPLLIYVVLNSRLKTLQSNMEFISRYIDPEEKYGESYCFFTHLVSACAYLAQSTEETIAKQKEEQARAREEKERKRQQQEAEAAAAEAEAQGEAGAESTETAQTTDEAASKEEQASGKDSEVAAAEEVPPAPEPQQEELVKEEAVTPQTAAQEEVPAKEQEQATAQQEMEDAQETATTETEAGDTTVAAATEHEAPKEQQAPKERVSFIQEFVASREKEQRLLDELSFVDKDASYFFNKPEDVAKLLDEYKRVAQLARRAVPRLPSRLDEWQCGPACHKVLSAQYEVGALLVADGFVWVGTKNGCVLVLSTDGLQVVDVVQVHKSGVTALAQVHKTVWCGTNNGRVHIVDQETAQQPCKPLSLHDRKHPEVVGIVVDHAHDTIWVAAVSPVTTSERSTQICAATLQKSVPVATKKKIILGGVVRQMVVVGDMLWALLDNGWVGGYSTATAEFVEFVGPFAPSDGPSAFAALAAPRSQSLWVAAKAEVRLLSKEEGRPCKVAKALSTGRTVLGITQASTRPKHAAAGADAPTPTTTATSPPTTPTPGQQSVADETPCTPWEDVVACVLDDGTVRLWDAEDVSVGAAAAVGAPRQPTAMGIGVATSDGARAHLVMAAQTDLYLWNI